MSALRYSGTVRIRITYLDPTFESPPPRGFSNNLSGEYRVFLRQTGGDALTIHLPAKIEAGSGVGVDHPLAFDAIARAALAFAAHERPDQRWHDLCAYAPLGTHVHVARTSAHAWPAP